MMTCTQADNPEKTSAQQPGKQLTTAKQSGGQSAGASTQHTGGVGGFVWMVTVDRQILVDKWIDRYRQILADRQVDTGR